MASTGGTQATFVVPNHFNGALTVHLVGSEEQHLLQIVPVVDLVEDIGVNAVRLRGRGFVEGNGSSYNLAGTQVTDDDSNLNIDVRSAFVYDNDIVDLFSLPLRQRQPHHHR